MAKFEDNLIALETVVERLERGDLSLEESVTLFEQGVKLSSSCKAELEAAEGRVQVLVDIANGKSATADFEMPREVPDGEEDEGTEVD